MNIHGKMMAGKRSVPVEVENTGRLLRITGPYTNRSVSFEGRRQISLLDRLTNWSRLAFGTQLPVRCAFAAVKLERSDDGLTLIVDPGWPWDDPLIVKIADENRAILTDWYRAAMVGQYGKDVRCDLMDNGFTISDVASKTVWMTVLWADVRAVRAFKRDLFAYDMICLAFQMPDKSWLEIWEESAGFISVVNEMSQVLPGIPEKWYTEIWVPVFATTDTLLYRRDEEQGHWSECWTCGYSLTGNTSGTCPECGARV